MSGAGDLAAKRRLLSWRTPIQSMPSREGVSRIADDAENVTHAVIDERVDGDVTLCSLHKGTLSLTLARLCRTFGSGSRSGVPCGCSAALTRASPGPRLFAPHEGAGEMLGTCKAIGDIEGATGPAFAAVLRDATDNSDSALVSVDCSAVTFMDPAGYHVVVEATRYAARRGHTLVIRNMSPPCSRLMRLYTRDRELRVERTPPHAGPARHTLRPGGLARPSAAGSNEARLFAFAVPGGQTLRQSPKRR